MTSRLCAEHCCSKSLSSSKSRTAFSSQSWSWACLPPSAGWTPVPCPRQQRESGSTPAAVARSACSWGRRSTSCAPPRRSRSWPLASRTAWARSRQSWALQRRRASHPSSSLLCALWCLSVAVTASRRICGCWSHEQCWLSLQRPPLQRLRSCQAAWRSLPSLTSSRWCRRLRLLWPRRQQNTEPSASQQRRSAACTSTTGLFAYAVPASADAPWTHAAEWSEGSA